MKVTLHIGDVFDVLATLPDGSVDVIVTSPPFLALRSYLPADHPDKDKEIGSEPTPAAFLDTLLDLTSEWGRVLAPHGSICVELGDTFSGSGGAGGDYNADGLREGQEKFDGSARRTRKLRPNEAWRLNDDGSVKSDSAKRRQEPKALNHEVPLNGGAGWPLAKSLCMIPTLYPASLAYGRNLLNPEHTIDPWRVRNLVVWARPNPPVGALGDKVRPSTSYITIACKSDKRYFDLDAERTAGSPNTHARTARGVDTRPKSGKAADPRRGGNFASMPEVHDTNGAPLLDHWIIPTKPYAGSHYAVFPPEIPRRLISLMCPPKVCLTCGEPSRRIAETVNAFGKAVQRRSHREDPDGAGDGRRGVAPVQDAPHFADRRTLGWTDCGHGNYRPGLVLDPFAGSGTTLAMALGNSRDSIGIDLDERNAELVEERVGPLMGLEIIRHKRRAA